MGRLLAVAFLVFLCGSPSGALLTRKRSTLEANDENRLIEALKVIERERQRLAADNYGTGYDSQPNDRAWQPEDDASQAGDDQVTNRLDVEFMRRLLDVGSEDVDTDDSPPVVSQNPVNDNEVNDIEAPSSTSSEQVVDPEKLKSIFTPSNPDSEEESSELVVKKTLPYQSGGPPADNEQDKRQPEDATDDEEREFEKLFERAANGDDFDDDAAQGEEVGRPLGVGQEEVTGDILPDGTTEIIKHAYGQEVVPGEDSDTNREWVAEKVALNSYPTVVRKRSDSWMDQAEDETPERFTDESLARTVDDDVSQYLALEDAEIDNLAKALDLATRSQLEKTDEYIPEEIRHLRQAIEYEGTLNDLRDSAEAAESAADDNEAGYIGNVADNEVPDIGRQFPPLDYRYDVNSDGNDDVTEEDIANKARLDNYIEKILRGLGNDVEEEEEEYSNLRKLSLKQWLEGDAESASTDEDVDNEWYLNPMLRRILKEYREGRLQKRAQFASQGTFGDMEDNAAERPSMENDYAGSDIDSYAQAQLAREYEAEREEQAILSQLSDSPPDECPAVYALNDNCAVARSKGLILDDEALDLCNRHQLCYACGAAYGLTRHNCDEGYLDESNQLCGGPNSKNPHCATDIIKLYVLMLSQHQPTSRASTPDICSATCTIDYIIGVDNNRT